MGTERAREVRGMYGCLTSQHGKGGDSPATLLEQLVCSPQPGGWWLGGVANAPALPGKADDQFRCHLPA